MLRNMLYVAVLAVALGTVVPSTAPALPTAWFQVGDSAPVYIADDQWLLNDGVWSMAFSSENRRFRVTGTAIAQEDPFISYGFTAVNHTGSALAFNFGILTPLNPPVDTENIVMSSFSGSWTDPTRNGLAVTPTLGDPDGDGVSEIAISEVNGVNVGMDAGTGFSIPAGYAGPNSGLFGGPPFMQGPANGPVGNWTDLSVRLGFTLSGYNDIATLNGYTSIVPSPVPEPATLLLLGGGLVGLAFVRRRTRKV